jgi:hypothetical protein
MVLDGPDKADHGNDEEKDAARRDPAHNRQAGDHSRHATCQQMNDHQFWQKSKMPHAVIPPTIGRLVITPDTRPVSK